VLLIDSLTKGWPFGTLLLWSVSSDEMASIPSRTFWTLVNRTDDEESQSVPKANPPAEFRMVLDGQQRIQSLLLALMGDDSGFKLPDRQWAAALEWDNLPAGSHWSKGSLSLNLRKYRDAYKEAGNVVWIDFRTVLEWTVDSPIGGVSNGTRPPNYKQPLVVSQEHRGTYVRLSRLWSIASSAYGASTGKLKVELTDLLKQQGVAEGEQENLMEPLLALLEAFADLKTTEVGYLRLLEYDPETFESEHYNDAIVNIFTRLNTAGRTLTRQEITFAWIKRQWDPAKTGDRWAPECFESVREYLSDRDVSMDMDDVVKGVSTIWAATFGGGTMLNDKDLLKETKLKPLAADLSGNWTAVEIAVQDITDALAVRRLEYQRHYRSLNAVFVLWAWRMLAEMWVRARKPKALEEDTFRKAVDAGLNDNVDRWMLLTQWAGRWASSTDKELARCAKDLATRWAVLRQQADPTQAATQLVGVLTGWIDDARADAGKHIESLGVSDRKQVRLYYAPLWIWHRLDNKRWAASSIPLRAGRRKTPRLDVDHVVAYALWQQWPKPELSIEEQEGLVNSIGNCVLLEKTFNVSKGTQSLQEFLEQTYEVKNGKVEVPTWLPAMELTATQAKPSEADLADLVLAIRAREKTIKGDLMAYVRGELDRVDPIGEPGPATPTPPKDGTEDENWRTKYRARYWKGFEQFLRTMPKAEFLLDKAPKTATVKVHPFSDGISVKAYCSPEKNRPGVYLSLKGPKARTIFETLRASEAAIGHGLAATVHWREVLVDSKYEITVEKEDGTPGIESDEEFRRQYEWLHATCARFIEVFGPRLPGLVGAGV
jgi:hypothetical protein